MDAIVRITDAATPEPLMDAISSQRDELNKKPVDGADLSLEFIIEAVLFVGGPALTVEQISGGIRQTDGGRVVEAVAALNHRYHLEQRPYEIRRDESGGYQMVLRLQFRGIVNRVHRHTREVRLSPAAVDVLSLVAYRQPATVQEVDAARGTDSAAILRQLRRRDLIEAVEEAADAGRTLRFRTTRRFLELFHISSLDELPRVQELDRA